MRQIVYAMQFKGKGAPGASANLMTATTSGPSCVITSTIGPEGLAGAIQPAAGGNAEFSSEVTLLGGSAFTEAGTITFGEGGHKLRFSTVGQGYIAPSADPKLQAGSVIWQVDGGEGQFEGASGLITSNFTVSDAGDVVDNQFGVIFVKQRG